MPRIAEHSQAASVLLGHAELAPTTEQTLQPPTDPVGKVRVLQVVEGDWPQHTEESVELQAVRAAAAPDEELADQINVLPLRQVTDVGDRLDRDAAAGPTPSGGIGIPPGSGLSAGAP
jgi:hypothetical protein